MDSWVMVQYNSVLRISRIIPRFFNISVGNLGNYAVFRGDSYHN
jgi:hypothetical protein